MALKASGKSDEELLQAMEETVLAYDNMCHLDALHISRKDFPLPVPFNKMWQKVGKVIDRLHLQNHKDPKCKIMYNPDSFCRRASTQWLQNKQMCGQVG